MFYKTIIEDLQQTNKRLNDELDSRVKYEYKLIDAIETRNKEIEALKTIIALRTDK